MGETVGWASQGKNKVLRRNRLSAWSIVAASWLYVGRLFCARLRANHGSRIPLCATRVEGFHRIEEELG